MEVVITRLDKRELVILALRAWTELNLAAVKKVFEVKGRPPDNPLIVHIAGTKQLDDIVDEIPDKGKTLGETFWPGPLTLVMKRTILVSDLVTAGLDTVAVRMPGHPVALAR